MTEPLVFLPGLLCDEALWRRQVAVLNAERPCHVADLTLDNAVVDMASRTLASAPSHFGLVALSMGGYVAFEILRQAPERVTRLALFATSAASDTPERAAQRRATIDALAAGRFRGVTRRLMPQLIHPSRVGEPIGEEIRAMAERVGAEAFLRQQAAILGRPDSRPLLSTIDVPTLVAVGDADALTPVSESDAIHAGISGSHLRVLEGCGHLPALELPDVTLDLLNDWLTT